MESAKTEDEKLQMFFDGELAPEEEAAMRRELEGSTEGQAQLREWERIRDAIQSVSSDWAGALDSDALFARIEADIDAAALPTEAEAPPVEPAPPVLRVVPGGRERRVWGAVATGFAAAAAIFLAVMTWPSEQAPSDGMLTRGTEVLEVDFGANAGTIFNVEGGAGESLAVVWIDDEEVGMP
jgi:negative regulator of sigma E activity